MDANEYGKALFLLTEERGTSDAVLAECALVCEVFCDNPKYAPLLDTPALPREEKEKMIDEAFSSLDADHKNFLKLLAACRAVVSYPACAKVYRSLYLASRGITEVEAVSAKPLSDKQRAALSEALTRKLGGKIELHEKVDPKVLGGLLLRYGGVQIDGTLETRLSNLGRNLRSVIVD